MSIPQPSFSLSDKLRSTECLPVLRSLSDALDINHNRKADTTDFLEHNKINIRFLEDQIEKLKEKLKQKQSDHAEVTELMKESEEVVKFSNNTHTGIYFRFVACCVFLLSLLVVSAAVAASPSLTASASLRDC
jgi:hypothetical protein